MAKKISKKQIEQYEHSDKERANNPHVGLVTPATDPDTGEKKTYEYDPHLDPQLQWAGKAEHTSFEVPTVSLHVHERIDPNTIIETVKKERHEEVVQTSLFEEYRQKPLREAIDFYKHKEGWTNRLIAGDSLLVMNSLLEKEGMAGKVQMMFFDPPYGIKYKSNFQAFTNKRDIPEGDKDEDLTVEPEMIKAFRDTWELGVHSYLTYIRDRLFLAKELLDESGSVFIQISDENMHLIKTLLDEVFGPKNKVATIAWKKGAPVSKIIKNSFNYLLWYAKDKDKIKSNKLYEERVGDEGTTEDPRKLALWAEFKSGEIRTLTTDEKRNLRGLPEGTRIFRSDKLLYRGNDRIFEIKLNGKEHVPSNGYHWRGDEVQMERILKSSRIIETPNGLGYKFFVSDFPILELTNWWDDTSGKIPEMLYAVQTHHKIVERAILLCTDPGDLVLDITCGSGTTAASAEKLGRRWITCDTSRVSIAIAKSRLMQNSFDYYTLKYPKEGVSSGFVYEEAPHITLKTVGNNGNIDKIVEEYSALFTKEGKNFEEFNDIEVWERERFYSIYASYEDKSKIHSLRKIIDDYFEAIEESNFNSSEKEYLIDNPKIDISKIRITGPFTVEAVPAPYAKSFDDLEKDDNGSDTSIARTGETLRQSEWRDELLRAGVRAKGGNIIQFTRVETLAGTKYIQAEAETKEDIPKKVLVVFGPEHAPLEQRMVENAWQEARALKPDMLLFCAFQFDEEAAKDIDELTPAIAGMQLLKAQMNADMLTDDLRKKRSSNESFWLVGQPDVKVHKLEKGKVQVEVMGFDYYNPKTGNVESGGKKNIAMWMLDTNYDNRSLFPSQVFFPMAGSGDGWDKLAKNLKAEIDEEKIEAFKGTVSLEFEPGSAIAVKIIDDRGIESLRVINM
jgi:adenine-specific DNA-methyltransferase